MPTNSYNIKNKFVPSGVAKSPYGWAHTPAYSDQDVPANWLSGASTISREELMRQFAYEWFQSSTAQSGYSNPPFVSGAAGRLLPDLQGKRILRGFIRRSNPETSDPISQCRLNFMYNPETITRDYVSYLDQASLDPFNSVYDSGNLIAPPSFIDFSFELFFDRQEEVAQNVDHPGVFADYQFFDLVVRNVIPANPNESTTQIPDNGVMMVNPKDVTVVFSPQLTIQGRPINARVSFEKFSHRMTPIRMRIAITMRINYFGPLRPSGYGMFYTPVGVYEALIDYSTTYNKAPGKEDVLKGQRVYQDTVVSGLTGTLAPTLPSGNGTAGVVKGVVKQEQKVAPYNGPQALKAVTLAQQTALHYGTHYSVPRRQNLPYYADCSSLVYWSYSQIGLARSLFYGTSWPSVEAMMNGWQSHNWSSASHVLQWDNESSTSRARAITLMDDLLRPGDFVIRYPSGHRSSNHIAMVLSISGSTVTKIEASSPTSSPEVGAHSASFGAIADSFNHIVRPNMVGAQTSARII